VIFRTNGKTQFARGHQRSWAVLRNAYLASPYDDFKSFLELHRNSFLDFEVNVIVDLLLAGIAMHQLTNLEELVHGAATQ
jgi:hypothetical protein